MERNYSTYIDNLIALCHIMDDFEDFEEKLLNVIAPKYNRDFVNQLWKTSLGKFYIGARKAKRFYIENKKVIDTINKYSNVPMFINMNYGYYGEIDGDIHFFYEYIINHKDEMDRILAVLKRLKELGFSQLEFDESRNFVNEKYKIYPQLTDCFEFAYLDQMEAIPSYRYDEIQYTTKESPYKITVKARWGNISSVWKDQDILSVGSYATILLNDLTFEPNRLPSTLSKEDTFDKIIGLPAQKQQQYSAIKDSVDLKIGLTGLYAMFNIAYDKINGLNNTDRKEELIASLTTIKEAISKMQIISSEYDKKIVDNNPNISQADLNEEKEEYARRRKLQNRHSS